MGRAQVMAAGVIAAAGLAGAAFGDPPDASEPAGGDPPPCAVHLRVQVNADGTFAIGRQALTRARLADAFDAYRAKGQEICAYLAAEEAVRYEEMLAILDLLRTRLTQRVGLVTNPR